MVAEIVTYEPQHFEGVNLLWQEAFPDDPPWNTAGLAVPAKLAIQPNLLLVAVDNGRVIGSTMAGYDGHRGWLYAVAVSKAYRRHRVGTALIREAEVRLKSLGCKKINLQLRASNDRVAQFYRHLGYSVEERISMGKRLEGL